ncbi:peptidylprolyl isomerase [candidate division KSB1 bacterium]|nr:peptidylprolyl isomerase [candidate division KSB1 bacterium]RQW06001.1 MAG: peptidylprolyl isomerase [candidate division KSB1 bacterium]
MTIKKDRVVSFHYTLTLDSGEIADTSDGREPLRFLVGSGQIIPGLENEMLGMSRGDSKVVTVQPEDAYGFKDQELIQTVDRTYIPDSINLVVGEQLEGQSEDGHRVRGQIASVDDQSVKIDFNHPLAGEVLTFDVKILNVRDASAEELDHGHAH